MMAAQKPLLVDASYMSVTECVVVTWSDHSAFAVPIEWFRDGPNRHKVDPLNLKIIDDGQTLALGEYEVDAEAIWFEFDKPPD